MAGDPPYEERGLFLGKRKKMRLKFSCSHASSSSLRRRYFPDTKMPWCVYAISQKPQTYASLASHDPWRIGALPRGCRQPTQTQAGASSSACPNGYQRGPPALLAAISNSIFLYLLLVSFSFFFKSKICVVLTSIHSSFRFTLRVLLLAIYHLYLFRPPPKRQKHTTLWWTSMVTVCPLFIPAMLLGVNINTPIII